MIRSVKVRIFPNPEQEILIFKQIYVELYVEFAK